MLLDPTVTEILLTGAHAFAATPAPSADGFLRWDNSTGETLIGGGLGGLFLALGRFIATYMRIHSPTPRIKQLLLAQIPPLIVLPILGAGVAYVTTGISGAFLTGVGALGFILLAAGPSHGGHYGTQEEANASADDQA